MSGDSDLIGVEVTLGVILAILAVFCAYFFVGVWLGTILLIGVIVLGITLAVRVVRKNELN